MSTGFSKGFWEWYRARMRERMVFTVIDQDGYQRGQFKTRDEAEAYLRSAPAFIDRVKSAVKAVSSC